MNSNYSQPVNLGNPEEFTIEDFAIFIRDLVGNNNEIVKLDAQIDDPQRRRPDITVAMRELGWKPKVKVTDGIKRTIEYFKNELEKIEIEKARVIELGNSSIKTEL